MWLMSSGSAAGARDRRLMVQAFVGAVRLVSMNCESAAYDAACNG